jgi:acyl-CoA synthetase (AMP-forming)/AMP-acid ligase II
MGTQTTIAFPVLILIRVELYAWSVGLAVLPPVSGRYLHATLTLTLALALTRYLHTGDVGYVDAEGRYYVVDRVKELIKVKGFQVAPAELEAILLSDVRVADAAVIGVPDERSGELPKAYVVRQAAHPALSIEQVKAYVAERTTSYKHLAHVEFVEAVPKSAAGKILRKDLRKMEDGRRGGSARSKL